MTPEHERLVERLECARDREHVLAPCKDLQDAQAAITALSEENEGLREALLKCLNYIANTKSELGITLDCVDAARAALGEKP